MTGEERRGFDGIDAAIRAAEAARTAARTGSDRVEESVKRFLAEAAKRGLEVVWYVVVPPGTGRDPRKAEAIFGRTNGYLFHYNHRAEVWEDCPSCAAYLAGHEFGVLQVTEELARWVAERFGTTLPEVG